MDGTNRGVFTRICRSLDKKCTNMKNVLSKIRLDKKCKAESWTVVLAHTRSSTPRGRRKVFVTAEIDEAVARAREGVDLTARRIKRCKRHPRTVRARQNSRNPSDWPSRRAVASQGPHQSTFRRSLPSRAKTYVSATNMASVRVNLSNKRLTARVRARARV